ncbi:DUF2177 family protein [Desulfobacula sp.]|uniref:DUF2177 family protein n=1 Tax=Desulfobacula sp. TaxID=2593537 RepID=UPI00261F6B1A|nr:DUF2177 family protein [Desulfobacula sp.]
MIRCLKVYGVALSAFLVVDLIWIGFIARTFYKDQLGFILASSPNWIAAIIFYLMFVAGLLFFVVLPGLKDNSLKMSFLRAAVFGALTYGTYDLTNLALIEGWPVLVTVVDIIWGMALSVIVSLVSVKAGRHFDSPSI